MTYPGKTLRQLAMSFVTELTNPCRRLSRILIRRFCHLIAPLAALDGSTQL